MQSLSDRMLEVGEVVGTHGLRGDVKVRPYAGGSKTLLQLERVWLRLPTRELVELEICRQTVHKGQVLLRFHDYSSLNEVESLLSSLVLAPASALPELAEDEYYWNQLEGLEVYDRRRGFIGCLEEMITSAAHDTYIVRGACGEIMIPAVKQFIVAIDLNAQSIQVDLPDGLIADD